MLQNNLFARENYLYFADSNYLAARLLILNDFYIPGISIAEQSVEQYLKLKIYELLDWDLIKKLRIERDHDLASLFKKVAPIMEKNKLSLRELQYYQSIIIKLNNAYRFRYFDNKGLLGELNEGKGVDLTFTLDELDKFDELCCELRNSVFIKGQGACPVNVAFKSKLFFKTSSMKGEALYLKNKQYHRFKIDNRSMVDLYSR